MTEHISKNTLGRSVPVKTKTDVEEDGTSEDGSPRPVCSFLDWANIAEGVPTLKHLSLLGGVSVGGVNMFVYPA